MAGTIRSARIPVDTSQSNHTVLILPESLIPIVTGVLAQMKYRAMYASDEDWERGEQWYYNIVVDLRQNVARFEQLVECVCKIATHFEQQQTPPTDPALLTAIANLTQAINNSGCGPGNGNGGSGIGEDDMQQTINVYCGCGNCGCQGQQQPPGQQPPGGYTPPQGNQPPWNGTELPEDKYRCEAAHFVFDAVKATLQKIQDIVDILQIFSIPEFIISMFKAMLQFLSSNNINAIAYQMEEFFKITKPGGLFSGMADLMETRKEEIICSLYQSQNTTEAITLFIDILENIAETVILSSTLSPFLGPLTPIVATVISEIINTDLLNNLFVVALDISYPDADCSNCGGGTQPYQPCYDLVQSGSTPLDPQPIIKFNGKNAEGLDTYSITPGFDPLNGSYTFYLKAHNKTGEEINFFVDSYQVTGTNPTANPQVSYYNAQNEIIPGPNVCCRAVSAVDTESDWEIILRVDASKMNDCAGCTDDDWVYPIAIYKVNVPNAKLQGCTLGYKFEIFDQNNILYWNENELYFYFDASGCNGSEFVGFIIDLGRVYRIDPANLSPEGIHLQAKLGRYVAARRGDAFLSFLADTSDTPTDLFTSSFNLKWLDAPSQQYTEKTHTLSSPVDVRYISGSFVAAVDGVFEVGFVKIRLWGTPVV